MTAASRFSGSPRLGVGSDSGDGARRRLLERYDRSSAVRSRRRIRLVDHPALIAMFAGKRTKPPRKDGRSAPFGEASESFFRAEVLPSLLSLAGVGALASWVAGVREEVWSLMFKSSCWLRASALGMAQRSSTSSADFARDTQTMICAAFSSSRSTMSR